MGTIVPHDPRAASGYVVHVLSRPYAVRHLGCYWSQRSGEVRQLQAGNKFAGIGVECHGESEDVDQADVALSPLNRTDIRPVQPGSISESLLRQSALLAQPTYPGAEYA